MKVRKTKRLRPNFIGYLTPTPVPLPRDLYCGGDESLGTSEAEAVCPLEAVQGDNSTAETALLYAS